MTTSLIASIQYKCAGLCYPCTLLSCFGHSEGIMISSLPSVASTSISLALNQLVVNLYYFQSILVF